MNYSHWYNDKWLVDYCSAVKKGEVIRLSDNKRFFFSKNIGLPSTVPNYIRNKAKEMTREEL